LVGAVEKWVASKETEEMIEQKLIQLCNLFPKYADMCSTLVITGIPQIIKYLEELETPTRVCQQLKLCPQQRSQQPFQCEGCLLLVGAVEKWVASKETEDMIEQKLIKLCNLFPKYTDMCSTMVIIGIPQIIKYLEEFETPTRVCQQLKLCPQQRSQQPFQCEGCLLLVGAVEKWVASKETEDMIEQKLIKLCNLFPKYADMCSTMVITGIPQIIKYLEEFETPERVCQQLGFCQI
jgi:ERCC4-related helicase